MQHDTTDPDALLSTSGLHVMLQAKGLCNARKMVEEAEVVSDLMHGPAWYSKPAVAKALALGSIATKLTNTGSKVPNIWRLRREP